MLWLFQLCYCLLLKAFNLERACKLVYSIGRHYFCQFRYYIDKFYVQLCTDPLIMVTYLLAQYLIVKGILSLN
jgi:hypothetical protein